MTHGSGRGRSPKRGCAWKHAAGVPLAREDTARSLGRQNTRATCFSTRPRYPERAGARAQLLHTLQGDPLRGKAAFLDALGDEDADKDVVDEEGTIGKERDRVSQ